MPGLLQGALRRESIASWMARAYAWSVAGRYEPLLSGVDLGHGLLLDVGAGPGHLTARIAVRDPGRRVVALDLSTAALKRAQQVLPESVARVAGDAMSLPFLSHAFDAAVSVASLKFWPDRERGLRELARVVRAGGPLVVSELDRGASDLQIDAFLRHIRLSALANRFGRGLMRAVARRSIDAGELQGLAARTLGGGEVTRVAELPFVRLVARAPGA